MTLNGLGVRESFFFNFAYLHIGKQSEMTKIKRLANSRFFLLLLFLAEASRELPEGLYIISKLYCVECKSRLAVAEGQEHPAF